MLTYAATSHTGRNEWNFESTGLITTKYWITCNGERVDMTTMGYPKAHLTAPSVVFQVLEIMDRREQRAR